MLLWEQIVSGVVTGGIYAAVAVGLTVTFGILDIVNFAHGGFVLVGGFTAAVLARKGVPLPLAVIISAGLVAVAAVVIERGLFRQTLSRPMNGLVISAGLLVITQNVILMIFGGDAESIPPMTFGMTSFLGAQVSLQRMYVGLVGFAMVIAFWLVMRFTRFGLETRVVAENREVAALMGINVGGIVSINFAIGALIASVAGVLLATIQPLAAFSADHLTMMAFIVIIVGSLGSIPGALFAGILVSVVTNIGIVYLDPSMSLVYQFGLVVLVLTLRPEGLFGRSLGVNRP